MTASGLLYALILLKFCEVVNTKITTQVCVLENRNLGKCVPIAFCPQIKNLTNSDNNDNLTRACEAGTVCCGVSAKIVTPIGGVPAPIGAAPATPVGSAPPTASASPQLIVVPPVNPSPAGGTGGAAPPTGSGPPAGSGGPPAGNAGGGPPAGGTPPAGGPPPAGGTPPNGATPPAGGGPPPIMASIIAAPYLPSKAFPASTGTGSDTIFVSAEIVDNAIATFDRKCDLYHSMVQSSNPIASNPRPQTPIVMIYGGTNSAEKEFPHMASLGYGDLNMKQWLCAGSLITEIYVVTAAHCLVAAPLGEVRYVKLGHTRLDQDTSNTQQFNVVGRTPHPQYDSTTHYNDIALLQLDRSVRMTEYVMPICLFSSTNYEDKNLIATGWGKTESGKVSMDLQKVGLELFSQSECQNAYSVVSKSQLPLGIQESTQVCAGSRTERKDTCQGDSGGPLQIRKNNRWYLIGITSVGIQCGNVNYPGVYTRIAYFVQWIQQSVWNK